VISSVFKTVLGAKTTIDSVPLGTVLDVFRILFNQEGEGTARADPLRFREAQNNFVVELGLETFVIDLKDI
jgi:hypothetical protein